MSKPRFKKGDLVSIRTDYMNTPKHQVIEIYKSLSDGRYLYNLTGTGCSAGCMTLETDIRGIKNAV